MALKAETSLMAALATGTIVYTIYNKGMPSDVDVRAGAPGEDLAESTRKQNAWMAAATVAGVSLVAKDSGIFIVGGIMVIALDWLARVNIWTNPATNKVVKTGEVGGPTLSIVPDSEPETAMADHAYVS